MNGQRGASRYRFPLDGTWLFGERLTPITLPHCVAKLSWQDWDPAAWQGVWNYRHHFAPPPEFRERRIFLQFESVMVGASPVINGHALPEHLGGYLPFEYEITGHLVPGDNVLSVAVDCRWKNVPPEGSPRGPQSVDYLEPGGIWRGVNLYAVPQVFLSDVFARPVQVLDAGRRVEVGCTVDAAEIPAKPVQVRTQLMEGGRVLSSAQQTVRVEKQGKTDVKLSLSKLGNVALWHPDSPRLYDVVTTLAIDGKTVHEHRTRIGFRDARFEVDGFFLNGERFRFFGLNRHELFPYTGGAMPPRVMRRDAEILRRDLNCNIVRCSHYPQTEAFLDRCDELGLMVWEEIPGWQYLGDAAWKELAVRDVKDMVLRDRNHASIVIWGVRVNESNNDPALYTRTRELAHSLDPSRPTSGSMTPSSEKTWREEWHEDVFAFDDYHAEPDGTVGIKEPLPGVPYMLAETVGQYNYSARKGFDAKYRRTADLALQQAQALRHAQAHDRALAWPRMAGVIAWCAFDYGSLVNSSRALKTPGIADVFRIPKLGASFYQVQVSPQVRPVIAPNFYWDSAAVKNAAIFSNCERLRISIDGKQIAEVRPDREHFPHLKYPPFFCDLDTGRELRIDGYVGDRVALSRSFSSDQAADQFLLSADDKELAGDGSDATRLVFQVADRFGAPRPLAGGEVKLEISGPGTIVGDNPFQLAESGGVGAVWIRTLAKRSGRIVVTATHSSLGRKSVSITVR